MIQAVIVPLLVGTAAAVGGAMGDPPDDGRPADSGQVIAAAVAGAAYAAALLDDARRARDARLAECAARHPERTGRDYGLRVQCRRAVRGVPPDRFRPTWGAPPAADRGAAR